MARRKTAVYKVVHPHGLNLRAEPSKAAAILRVLPTGAAVEPETGEIAPDGWLPVKGGGYVMREFLE